MNKLKSFLSKVNFKNYISGILMLIFGIIFMAVPNESYQVVCFITGALLLIMSIFMIIDSAVSFSPFRSVKVFTSIALLIIAILCFSIPGLIYTIMVFIFAIYMISDGFSLVYHGVELKKYGVKNWIYYTIAGALMVTFGIISMIFFTIKNVLMIVTGIALLVSGITKIVYTFIDNKKNSEVIKKHQGVIDRRDDVIDLTKK